MLKSLKRVFRILLMGITIIGLAHIPWKEKPLWQHGKALAEESWDKLKAIERDFSKHVQKTKKNVLKKLKNNKNTMKKKLL